MNVKLSDELNRMLRGRLTVSEYLSVNSEGRIAIAYGITLVALTKDELCAIIQVLVDSKRADLPHVTVEVESTSALTH
jgi:hypothetical protein